MQFIPAKTIVTRTKNTFWFGADYNMNIYRGCSHGCIYCDSRSECYRVDDFEQVRAKENAVELIGRDLAAKRSKGVVATGAMSDPYNLMEKTYELTRGALEKVYDRRFGIGIATKSDLVTRDIDLLQSIAKYMPVIVKVTITAADDALCRNVEPHVCPSSARFRAIEQLAKAGVFVGVLMMPVLPFIEDAAENILDIVRMAAENGAKFVFAGLGVTMRDRQRDWFYTQLDDRFPGVRVQYEQRFGDRYQCSARNARTLYNTFAGECKKQNLLFEMEEIIRAYRSPYEQTQISFF